MQKSGFPPLQPSFCCRQSLKPILYAQRKILFFIDTAPAAFSGMLFLPICSCARMKNTRLKSRLRRVICCKIKAIPLR